MFGLNNAFLNSTGILFKIIDRPFVVNKNMLGGFTLNKIPNPGDINRSN